MLPIALWCVCSFFCIFFSGTIPWVAKGGRTWKFLQDGCRCEAHVPGRSRPSAKANVPAVAAQREVPRALETVQGDVSRPQTQDEPRCPSSEAQSSLARPGQALGAMGNVPCLAVQVLKAEWTKARAASKQPAVDVEIDQCRNFIARSERRIKELDSQRAEECASMTQNRRSVSRGRWKHNREAPRFNHRIPGHKPADGQHVAGRKRCLGAGVAPGEANSRRRHSASGQETGSSEAGGFISRFSSSHPLHAQ